MLKVCVLASTSKGNSTYVRVGKESFLIDAGLSARKISKALREIGENVNDLRGIILTHEHHDHITGIRTLSREYHKKCWLTFDTYQKIRSKVGNIDAEFIAVGEEFHIGEEGVEIMPYEISHDASDPVAFLVKSPNGVPLVGYLNDCGRINPFLLDGFRKVKILQVESNYSFDLLLKSSYPFFLKERLLGKKGHFSNWEAAEFIASTEPQVAILSHISENCNTHEVALAEVESILAHYTGLSLPFLVMVPYNGRSVIIQNSI
ncbi:MAG: MBL fold metallo-hydrolase [Candidatus Heimdallarchaeota archaeon]|nr:MAG: MBL fold metallo-hydrolase [Candidatus Heimdallarchaeota archaeon]